MMHRCLWAWLPLCCVTSTTIAAQRVVQLQPNGNEIGMESRAERWWYDGSRPTQFSMFGEWISLSASGMLVSPGVLTWSATIRPYVGQQDGTGSANGFDSRNLGLSFGGNILSAFPLSLSLNAHRSSGHLRSGLGGENDFFTSGGGALLSWRNDWFPLTLDISSRATEDAWTSVTTNAPIRRDEILRDVRVQGQSSKTLLLLDRISYRDRLGALSFRSLDATFEHTLRWGTGSVLNSSLQYGRRDGSYAYDRNAAGWRVLLRQSDRVSTDAFVQHRGGTSSGVQARSLAAGGAVRFRPSDSWTNALSASWTSTEYRDGGSSIGLLAWRAQVNRKLGGSVMLNSAVAATYERLGQWTSGRAFLDVFDERHTVDEQRTITLANARVDSTTVRLRSADQTLVYVSGVDFRLVPIGASLRVQLLPGSRLLPGSLVLVSYRFVPIGSGEHGVAGLTADLAVGSSALLLRASGAVHEAHGPAGSEDVRLLSGRDRGVGLTVRQERLGVRLELDAQHRRRTASTNDFLTNELRMGVVPRGTVHWQTNFGVRGSVSTVAGEVLTLASADGAVTWMPSATLRVLLSGERWLWRPTNASSERYLAGGLEVDWQFGRIETALRYGVQRRIAQLDNNQHRLSARVVRRF